MKNMLLYLMCVIVIAGYSQVNSKFIYLLPHTKTNDTLIIHKGYSVVFNDISQLPLWTAYFTDLSKQVRVANRKNKKFTRDPLISSQRVNNGDYKKSGFDRGHMVPAADMSWDEDCMKESFYFSNICPQEPSLNRDSWKKLEEQIREWVIEYDSLLVITGPILAKHQEKTIGSNRVSVPIYFYKIVYDYSSKKRGAISFKIPNIKLVNNIYSYLVSIDEIEEVTEINFFSNLPKAVETNLEKTICKDCVFRLKH